MQWEVRGVCGFEFFREVGDQGRKELRPIDRFVMVCLVGAIKSGIASFLRMNLSIESKLGVLGL